MIAVTSILILKDEGLRYEEIKMYGQKEYRIKFVNNPWIKKNRLKENLKTVDI